MTGMDTAVTVQNRGGYMDFVAEVAETLVRIGFHACFSGFGFVRSGHEGHANV